MLHIYKTLGEELVELEKVESGAWINLIKPTPEEIQQISAALPGLDNGFLVSALDSEERARVEVDNGQTLIIVDIPYVEVQQNLKYTTFNYSTLPMAILLYGEVLLTICLEDTPALKDFTEKRVKGFFTFKRTRFILQILYRNASRYLSYLRQIDKKSSLVEEELHKSMKNKELIQMLGLEKSLVYFSTSLNGNENVLEKLLRLEDVKKYPDDTDLLEDVIIENKQAIEMCRIYRDILSGTMDAFASVISNNLNIVMKYLTVLTMLLTTPALIGTLWGMNVPVPFETSPWGFAIVLGFCGLATGAVALWMYIKRIL